MKLEIDHSKKLVSVRLTQAESGDKAVQAQLRALCPSCWQRRYTVAVYHSSPGLLPGRSQIHSASALPEGARPLSGKIASKNNLTVFGNIHPEIGR